MADFKPTYIVLMESGELEKRAASALTMLKNCTICPWDCHVNRISGELGQCRTGRNARVYSFVAHHGEELPLRGTRGSGTIFFSGCNMHCQFCQNADISQECHGMDVEAEKLAEMMLSLQERGCHNINLVSPSHVVPQILEALAVAAGKGLSLPLVYNTGGYDKVETLRLLDGIVDIYMPDMKYAKEEFGRKYSKVRNYPSYNQAAVREMHIQVDDLQLDKEGIAQRGLLVRHLVLPEGIAGTGKTMRYIAEEISIDTYVNIMDQYRPEYRARKFPELSRRLTRQEYLEAVNLAVEAGLKRLDT